MEGVNIVQTIIDTGTNSTALWYTTIGMILFACAMLMDSYNSWVSNKSRLYAYGVCCVAVVCFVVIGLAWRDGTPGETRYIVTVDDSVNFNEFCSKYEIIERNGSMYIVREIGFGNS